MNHRIRAGFLEVVSLLALGLASGWVPIHPPLAQAAVPGTINYQGQLLDDQGAPLDGTVGLSFRLFSGSTGGSALWTETHASVDVEEGIFHVALGSVTPFPPDLFADPTRYLETSVEGVALSPRRPLAAVPYALHAASADVAGNAVDPLWDEGSGNVYRVTGNVGIGLSDPSRRLYIQGADLALPDAVLGNEDLTIEDGDAILGLYSNTSGVYGSGLALGEVASGALTNRWDLIRHTRGDGAALDFRYYDGVASIAHVRFGSDGKVGIGTESPTSELTVEGKAEATQLQATANLGSVNTPDVGGVYGDNVVYAWARVNGAGTLEASHGIASVTRLGTGWYRVVFKRALPSALIPMVIAYSANDVVAARIASTSTDRCDVRLDLWVPGSGFQAADYRFLITLTGRP
ncbi:MAG: hypothetical protein IT349_11110 [Candidatus Eisenbacteria bacterium]|nr:hypothetical protein [Candidatus Eisenbacteria bacterium]MCC7142637.1 hypothetical protein [Candidatus Eisenbacteria bacterium]